MNYQEREEAKREAWTVLSNPEVSANKKAWYVLNKLIAAHYWRAREDVDGAKAEFRRRVHGRRYSRLYELDIDVYTRHWLWANAESLLAPEVIKDLAVHWYYEPEEHTMMPKGTSMYGERGQS